MFRSICLLRIQLSPVQTSGHKKHQIICLARQNEKAKPLKTFYKTWTFSSDHRTKLIPIGMVTEGCNSSCLCRTGHAPRRSGENHFSEEFPIGNRAPSEAKAGHPIKFCESANNTDVSIADRFPPPDQIVRRSLILQPGFSFLLQIISQLCFPFLLQITPQLRFPFLLHIISQLRFPFLLQKPPSVKPASLLPVAHKIHKALIKHEPDSTSFTKIRNFSQDHTVGAKAGRIIRFAKHDHIRIRMNMSEEPGDICDPEALRQHSGRVRYNCSFQLRRRSFFISPLRQSIRKIKVHLRSCSPKSPFILRKAGGQ